MELSLGQVININNVIQNELSNQKIGNNSKTALNVYQNKGKLKEHLEAWNEIVKKLESEYVPAIENEEDEKQVQANREGYTKLNIELQQTAIDTKVEVDFVKIDLSVFTECFDISFNSIEILEPMLNLEK